MAIYQSFSTVAGQEDVLSGNITTVTTGLWSQDTGSLITGSLHLDDDQLAASGEYYFDVYNIPSTEELAEVQFSVAYGHVSGSGAPTLVDNEQSKLPTTAIYSQYRNLLLGPTDTKFTFGTGDNSVTDEVYVINFNRARYKEQLDPGNWQLPLSGANGVSTFIDDSGQTLGSLTANSRVGRVYNVVSGSITSGSGVVVASSSMADGTGYGKVYPDLGIIVLHPGAIAATVGFYTTGSALDTGTDVAASPTTATQSGDAPLYTEDNITTLSTAYAAPYAPFITDISNDNWAGNLAAYNHAALFVSMKRATEVEDVSLRARSAETVTSQHFFVRLRNGQFNYSNNPTFVSSNGEVLFPEFRRNPQVYITTVGLYNQFNELLAVAKLSKPVKKSFEEEILLRVRLDF